MKWLRELFHGKEDNGPPVEVSLTVESTGIDPKDKVQLTQEECLRLEYTSINIPESIGEPVRAFLMLVEQNPRRFKATRVKAGEVAGVSGWFSTITDKQTGEVFSADYKHYGYGFSLSTGPEWMTDEEVQYATAFIDVNLSEHHRAREDRVKARRAAIERARLMKIYKGE